MLKRVLVGCGRWPSLCGVPVLADLLRSDGGDRTPSELGSAPVAMRHQYCDSED